MTICVRRDSPSRPARFSASVRPVTVIASPCSSPRSSSRFISGIRPPILISSAIMYLPLGLRSAITGERLPMRVKSAIDSFTPAECAIASRCSTALVDPPSAAIVTIAFSKAWRVRMSRGRMLRSINCTTAAPACRQSSRLVVGDRRLRGAVRQAEPQRFDRRRHGVGGVHAAARTRRRDRRAVRDRPAPRRTAFLRRAGPPLRTPTRCRPACPGTLPGRMVPP